MSDYKELHNEAMELAERAIEEKNRNNTKEALELNSQAFEKEKEVALASVNENEPLRSILLRSAATLAYRSDKLKEAERLVHLALSGEPPEDIKSELDELLQEITFKRHLEVRNVTLSGNELQLSLQGDKVAPGFIHSDSFIDRFQALKKMILRTVCRLGKMPYEDFGLALGQIPQFDVFMSIARAQSYAVTIRLGAPKGIPVQGVLEFNPLPKPEKVIDEVVDCLGAFVSEDQDYLSKKIKDPSYYRSFVSLAKNLAPDDKGIKTVGITLIRDNKEKILALNKTAKDYKISLERIKRKKRKTVKIYKVTGFLKQADSVTSRNIIKILDDKEKLTRVVVPSGMMDGIVEKMWNRKVKARLVKSKGNYCLKKIDFVE